MIQRISKWEDFWRSVALMIVVVIVVVLVILCAPVCLAIVLWRGIKGGER